MKRIAFGVALVLFAASFWLWGQRSPRTPLSEDANIWEYRWMLPRELGRGRYMQVDLWEVESLGRQGWELVSAVPWVLRNDERGPKGEEYVVTQSYVAYFFKRPRERPGREGRPGDLRVP
jgi:hypothetical protein